MDSSEIIHHRFGPAVDADYRQMASPSATYGRLVRKGFRCDEAGNITAYMWGIPPVEGGWHPREIVALLSLRHAVTRKLGANRHRSLRNRHSSD